MPELLFNAALIPVVMGLVSAFKIIGMDSRFAPILSIVLGLGLSLLIMTEPFGVEILGGIVVGLSASGLYSGAKATFKTPTIE